MSIAGLSALNTADGDQPYPDGMPDDIHTVTTVNSNSFEPRPRDSFPQQNGGNKTYVICYNSKFS